MCVIGYKYFTPWCLGLFIFKNVNLTGTLNIGPPASADCQVWKEDEHEHEHEQEDELRPRRLVHAA